ncbi:23 kDa integral membrane protein [Fundulus heteroclitus]|uniref:23 kDa integral membrane protein n=1 Tax=Fundulus heteroclitus TaxID=8078 RepID=UPI00165B9F48|nr:23 kDa integral membrane protein [Fundulus heteroclitus]
MAHINSCLKRTFIGFNLLFAVIGLLIIGLTMLCQIYTSAEEEESMENRTTGLIGLYIMGAVTMMLGLLGAYGAYREHKVSLIVFLVCMIIGALVMIRGGIPTAITRPQIEGMLEQKFREFLPLNSASFQVKNMADTLQTKMHCCGLFSYTDWNGDIPASCLCSMEEEEEGYECKRISYNYLMQAMNIYSKPCFPILIRYVLLFADVMLGVFFTLAALAVLGMILSSIMIHQLRHPNRAPLILGIHTIFTPGPPKYEELHNPPPPY